MNRIQNLSNYPGKIAVTSLDSGQFGQQCMYVYLTHNQPPGSQSRDRYECSVWTVHQTGFDPSASGVSVYGRVAVQGPPPGTDTAIGAIAGAVIGAAISNPWDRGSGAVFGALTATMISRASRTSRAGRSIIGAH